MSKMPVLFIGHGSPMNAMEDNQYSRTWVEISKHIPKPDAILSISAHWYTKGTRIMNEENPKTIYDMYGFPKELYDVTYDVKGAPVIAQTCKQLITSDTSDDNTWGIDHGTWSVLVHMYPKRDIPVFQISIDRDATMEEHYRIGKELGALREKGVLILGSGNIVHNLRMVDWNQVGKGFDWAHEFDDYIYDNIIQKKRDTILNYENAGECARLAVPTRDHFLPLLYTLGATDLEDCVRVYNKVGELGSLTMTSYLWE